MKTSMFLSLVFLFQLQVAHGAHFIKAQHVHDAGLIKQLEVDIKNINIAIELAEKANIDLKRASLEDLLRYYASSDEHFGKYVEANIQGYIGGKGVDSPPTNKEDYDKLLAQEKLLVPFNVAQILIPEKLRKIYTTTGYKFVKNADELYSLKNCEKMYRLLNLTKAIETTKENATIYLEGLRAYVKESETKLGEMQSEFKKSLDYLNIDVKESALKLIEDIANKMPEIAYTARDYYYDYELPRVNSDTETHYGNQVNSVNTLINGFVNSVKASSGPTLDIGCGFGINAIRALKENQDALVYAIDLCATNIAVLIRFLPMEAGESSLKRLYVAVGNFPHDFLELKDSSFKNIILSHVTHYSTPIDEDLVFSSIKRILTKKEGRLFFQALTHLSHPFKSRDLLEELKVKAAKFEQDVSEHSIKNEDPHSRYPLFSPFDGEQKGPTHPQHLSILRYNLDLLGLAIVADGYLKTFSDKSPLQMDLSKCGEPEVVAFIAQAL